MPYSKLFLILIISTLTISCGGSDSDTSTTTNSNTTDDDISTVTNNDNTATEWRIIKEEMDGNKDGSIDGTLTYSYDTNNRLVKVEGKNIEIEGTSIDTALSIDYNAEGQWSRTDTSITIISTASEYKSVVTYNYDVNDGKLTEIRTDNFNDGSIDEITTLSYNIDGKLEKEDSFNETGALGDSTTYIYDASGRMIKTEEDTDGNGIIDDEIIYTYDGKGNLVQYEGKNHVVYYTWEAGKFNIGKGIPIEWFLTD